MFLLIRPSLAEDGEVEAANKIFEKSSRWSADLFGQIEPGELVIPRYYVLPNYQELEYLVHKAGGVLPNTYRQHRWIAGFHWYDQLKDFTPKTWTEDDLWRLEDSHGPFVLKGETNSKKWQWDTHMYAETKKDAVQVMLRLKEDGFLEGQKIKVRKYVPLMPHEESVKGPPFSREFRFFYWHDYCLAEGYYWSIAEDIDVPVPPEAQQLAQEVAEIACQHARFFVLDIAQTAEGGWILVEVNDGQMSGLSTIEPHSFYQNLKRILEGPILS